MKFSLDYKVSIGESSFDSKALLDNINTHKGDLSDVDALEGALVVKVDNRLLPAEYGEPIIRLAHLWLSKMPWVIGGDTETVALRNSAECFAFVPTGDGVEISFYAGDDTEIEEYILEPTIVRLDQFVDESLRMGERLAALLTAANPDAYKSSEDCHDFRTSLDEAKRAWKDYQLHQRR